MVEQETVSRDLGLTDLIDMIWDSWIVVAVIALVSLLVGAVLVVALPERFRSSIEITPLNATRFADFAGLRGAEVFKYSPEELLLEYSKYLTDRDRLGAVEAATNARNVLLEFNVTRENGTPGASMIRMTATHGDEAALDRFVEEALERSSRDLAQGLRTEVERRVAANDENRAWLVGKAQLEIAAERERLKAERQDSITRLRAEAQVARSFGLDRPIELQAQMLTVARTGGMQQPAPPPPPPAAPPATDNSQGQALDYFQARAAGYSYGSNYPVPSYLDGYLALEEQLKLLTERDNDDPFILNLRDLEKTIYLLANDGEKTRILALLDRSGLGEPEKAQLATYSLTAAKARKSFPRPAVMLGTAVSLGLMLGIGVAIFMGIRRLKASMRMPAAVQSHAATRP